MSRSNVVAISDYVQKENFKVINGGANNNHKKSCSKKRNKNKRSKFCLKNFILLTICYLAGGILLGGGFMLCVGVEWLALKIAVAVSAIYLFTFAQVNDPTSWKEVLRDVVLMD